MAKFGVLASSSGAWLYIQYIEYIATFMPSSGRRKPEVARWSSFTTLKRGASTRKEVSPAEAGSGILLDRDRALTRTANTNDALRA
jgi:hypothetical protein